MIEVDQEVGDRRGPLGEGEGDKDCKTYHGADPAGYGAQGDVPPIECPVESRNVRLPAHLPLACQTFESGRRRKPLLLHEQEAGLFARGTFIV